MAKRKEEIKEEEKEETKEKIKEDVKVERVNSKEETKSQNNNFIYGILVCLLVVLVLIIILWQSGILSLNNTKNSDVKLKYTETSTTIKKDGVYVTDVSDIVEDVMPSIVSITSKTLVSNGFFGFNYNGNERYTEGA